MDIFLIIGLVLGAICIMMALILKGASVAMLLNGEVAVIIFGGMIAAVLSSYTMADIKRLPKVMKVLMLLLLLMLGKVGQKLLIKLL